MASPLPARAGTATPPPDPFLEKLTKAEQRDAQQAAALWDRCAAQTDEDASRQSRVQFSSETGSPTRVSRAPSPATTASPPSSRSSGAAKRAARKWGLSRRKRKQAKVETPAVSMPSESAAKDAEIWKAKVANLAKRFPNVETADIDLALRLTNGHAGEAGGELTRITGQRPIDPSAL